MRSTFWIGLFVMALLAVGRVEAQELPYFVTYSHNMEEPGSLEVETKTTAGRPVDGQRFFGSSMELEYGTRAWWTSELYLDWQKTAGQDSQFGGFRIENRFRPLMREHAVNPVLYVEFEDINGANRSLLEVVGHDGQSDLAANSAEAWAEKAREVELKLILSSNVRGWNVSWNVIGEKNLKHAPWEFGYAVGAARPLSSRARARECHVCAENFAVGAEMYGGLGDTASLGLHDTSHYVAGDVNWAIVPGFGVSFSPGFGLNDNSLARVYRFGVTYETGRGWPWAKEIR